MRSLEVKAADLLCLDRLPACVCGDIGGPGARVCGACGRWLELDDALREKRDRMVEVRAAQAQRRAA